MTIDKIKAVLTSIVTWINVISAVLVILAEEIVNTFTDDDTARNVSTLIVRVIVVLTGIVTVIRRVTPVLPSQRGLTLPKNAPNTLKIPTNHNIGGNGNDRGESSIALFCIIIVAVGVAFLLFGR